MCNVKASVKQNKIDLWNISDITFMLDSKAKGAAKIVNNFKIKDTLEKNKIYFETIVMAALTFMGIVVAIVGVRIDQRNQEISQKELEILTNEREPYFCFAPKEKPILRSDGLSTYEVHEIVNMGGAISGASFRADVVVLLSFITGEQYGFILHDMVRTANDGKYDNAKKSFIFYENYSIEGAAEKYHSIDNQFISDLQMELIDVFGEPSVVVSKAYRFIIIYADYKNEQHCISYLFKDNGFFIENGAQVESYYNTFGFKNDIYVSGGSSQVERYLFITSTIDPQEIKRQIKNLALIDIWEKDFNRLP